MFEIFHAGFRGTVTQYHNDETVKLSLKGESQANTNVVQFHSFVNEIGALKNQARFYLNPLLCNGILQTMYLGAADYSQVNKVYYGRRIVTFADGGVATADYVIPSEPEGFKEREQATHPENWPRLHPRTRFLRDDEHTLADDTRPLVIVCHGLAGGSHEPIIRSLTDNITSSGDVDCVVLNSRGCARSKITTPELFSGLSTDDLREFINATHKKYPNKPLFAVGFSFGSTVLANYLGEEGDNTPIACAAVVSNPWDMVDSAYCMVNRYWSRKLFSESIAGFLVRMVKVNMGELHENPAFTEEKLKKKYYSTVDFDSEFTAPCFGFETAYDYYRHASSVNRILNIKVPTLVINSSDDPVVGTQSIPRHECEANPYLVLCETDLGGHLAWLQSDGTSWVTKNVAEYFNRFAREVDCTKRAQSSYHKRASKFDYKLYRQ